MSATSGPGWIGGSVVDEFDKAERDDYLLDRAFDEDLRRDDWDELHGEHRGSPSLGELLRLQHRLKQAQAERSAELLRGVEEGPWKTSGNY